MTDRIELLLDIARVNMLHSSECSNLTSARRAIFSDDEPVLSCDCWLSRPPGQEETSPAKDLRSNLPSPEELEWALQYFASMIRVTDDLTARAARFLLTEYEELRWQLDGLNK